MPSIAEEMSRSHLGKISQSWLYLHETVSKSLQGCTLEQRLKWSRDAGLRGPDTLAVSFLPCLPFQRPNPHQRCTGTYSYPSNVLCIAWVRFQHPYQGAHNCLQLQLQGVSGPTALHSPAVGFFWSLSCQSFQLRWFFSVEFCCVGHYCLLTEELV